MRRVTFFKVYGATDPAKEAARMRILPLPSYRPEVSDDMFRILTDRIQRVLWGRPRSTPPRSDPARFAHQLVGKELPTCRNCGYGGKVEPSGLCFRCSGEKAKNPML